MVAGQCFTVAERSEIPGQYDLIWVSGPHEGYGFSWAGRPGGCDDDEAMRTAIKVFLVQVNPETGDID